MTKPKYKQFKANIDRDCLNRAVDVADKMQEYEKILIEMLFEIDRNRYFVRYGFNSLLGFCIRALSLSRTQSQRIVTSVRRYVGTSQHTDPTVNLGNEKVGGTVDQTENRSDH